MTYLLGLKMVVLMAEMIRKNSQKRLFYYTHDVNMRYSADIKKIENVMGSLIGYACYSQALEYLAGVDCHAMPLDDHATSSAIGIPHGLYNLLNTTALTIGAFYLDDNNMVRSNYIDAFLEEVEKKSRKKKSTSQ